MIRHITILSLLAVAIPLGALATGCSQNPVTGKRELILIPPEQEIAMGQQAAPEFEKEFGGRVPNERLQSYVASVGQKVAAVSDRDMPYEFTLVSSDVANAFALPGGQIFITAGLMVRMTNERQLAAVLAHEVSHVAAKHNVKGMQRQMGAAVLVEVAGRAAGQDKAQAAEAVTKVVTSVGNLKYGRDDEYQADEVGIKYLAKAGYNPWGMIEMLTVLYNLSESEPGSLGELFQTHPLTSKRIEDARLMVEQNHPKYSSQSPDPAAGQFLEMRKLLK